jgi:hypothetical protein
MKRPSLSKLGKKLARRSQTGQSVILLAIAMIALIAFVGLVTDISLLFVRFSTLRRAVDAAAIAAAGQIREGRDHMDLIYTAYEFTNLYGIGVDDINEIFVETCDTNPGDPELCTSPRRKLVRITGQISSPTTFLRLIGWETVRLEATSTAEAAVLDVALLLDTSESMSKETCYNGVGSSSMDCTGLNDYEYFQATTGMSAPDHGYIHRGFSWGDSWNDQNWGKYCNDPDNDGYYDDLVCQPFQQVRQAAASFINRLDFVRGDRVVVITFDRYAIAHDPDCAWNDPLRFEKGCENNADDYLGDLSGSGGEDHTIDLSMMIDNKNIAREVIIGNADPDGKLAASDGAPIRPGIGVFSFEGYVEDPATMTIGWNKCWSLMDGVEYTYTDVAPCGNTNIGGAILAGDIALNGGDPNRGGEYMGTVRSEAVWVMVLLTDGAANATDRHPDATEKDDYGYYGYCPPSTFQEEWYPDPVSPFLALKPACRDEYVSTRHTATNVDSLGRSTYDADDYARDMADLAGLEEHDYIAIFTIGLGDELVKGRPNDGRWGGEANWVHEPWHGEELLRYIADVGDNGNRDGILTAQVDVIDGICEDPNPAHSNPDVAPIQNGSCGNYFFAPRPDELYLVFEAIADRLFTRVAR